MLFDLRTKAHPSYFYQQRAARMNTEAPPKISVKVYTKPAKVLSTGFLFLGGKFGYKNGNNFAQEYVNEVLKHILCNQRFQLHRADSKLIQDTLNRNGELHDYNPAIYNSLYISKASQIGDCGFGSMGGWDTAKQTNVNDPQTYNLSKLWVLALIELGLSNCGYLISTAIFNEGYLTSSIERKILHDISKYCGVNIPIMNPHMEDYKTIDDSKGFKGFHRSRYFVLIHHEGLKAYYQSKEFAELGLLTQ